MCIYIYIYIYNHLFSFWPFDVHSTEQMMAVGSCGRRPGPEGHYMGPDDACLDSLQLNALKIATSILTGLGEKRANTKHFRTPFSVILYRFTVPTNNP